MMHRIGGNVDFSRRVICEYRIPAIGVADAAGKIAACYIDLHAAAGGKGMMYIPEMHRYGIDLTGQ